MKKTLILLTAFLFTLNTYSQQGKPFGKIFSNFNFDLSEGTDGEDLLGTRDNYKEFEVKRAYLGYGYKIDDQFSAKITFDIGSNSAGSAYTAFLKIASLNWKATENISMNMGMIGTKNFKFMEKAWGRRYIEKSALDKYKWASSADAGINMDMKISENFSIDAQVINGEGYKNTQDDLGMFRYGAGLTYKLNSISLRLFRDMVNDNSDISQNITTAAIAYSANNIKLGVERNIMENASNISDQTKNITSVYGSYTLNDRISIFARMDNVSSENDWNSEKDGVYNIGGIERKMSKNVNLSVNVQSWKGLNDLGSDEVLFVNLECKL
ncbi:MAG: hypothetical protein CMP51_03190 [Flavobacteriales bacterium]|nr:hypothetical protein [Flavobacteriales bacterium]|tara:strand:+ start:542 stop:1516 length:975 start_codon:yes stop_codon:yes gene_type:complete